MTTRKELMELLKGIPDGVNWLDAVMQRLKDKDPLIYNYMIAKAKQDKLKEKNS